MGSGRLNKGEEQAQLVLQALRKAHRPVGAYDIIATLRGEAALAPPTVYRALDRLIADGLVHKVESLKAYVACRGHGAHQHAAAFAICDSCGSVEEFRAPSVAKALNGWARGENFDLSAASVEVHGTCAGCRDPREAAHG